MFNKNCKIYGIIDEETCLKQSVSSIDFAKLLLDSGLEVLQYRNKKDSLLETERKFNDIFKNKKENTILIINDYDKIAEEYGCILHVGQEDALNSKNIVFGRSTHSIKEVKDSILENPQPEYIGFGTIFPSETKPDLTSGINLLPEVFNIWKKDIVLIGGIKSENISRLPKKENCYYAIISDFFSQGNRINKIENQIKKIFSGLE